MDDVQNLEQGLPNTNSSQIKQGRGKSNKINKQDISMGNGTEHRCHRTFHKNLVFRMLSVCEVPKPITFGADPSLWPRPGDFAPCAVR